MTKRKHVVVTCTSAFGHLIPLLSFGKAVCAQAKASDPSLSTRVTVIASAAIVPELYSRGIVSASDNDVRVVPLHDGNGIFDSFDTAEFLTSFRNMERCLPQCIVGLAQDREWPIDAVVAEVWLVRIGPFIEALLIPFSLFSPVSALVLAAAIHRTLLATKSPKGDPLAMYAFNTREAAQRVLADLNAVSALSIVQKTSPLSIEELREMRDITRAYQTVDCIYVHTVAEIEPLGMQMLRRLKGMQAVQFKSVGPLALHENAFGSFKKEDKSGSVVLKQSISSSPLGAKVLAWLDEQRDRSIAYISFGSIATLSHEQMNAFCEGVEDSGYRFVWALHPSQQHALPSSFRAAYCISDRDSLPEWRSKRGLVVGWAPQRDLLFHSSISLFLSHCGWNSTLEAMAAGVPILAWPMFGDQHLDAVLLQSMGCCLVFEGTKLKGGRLVCSEEISRLLQLMVGSKSLREAAKAVKGTCWRAIEREGSSWHNLENVFESSKTKVARL
ncbi:hypothetical protein BC830DRAFT_1110899 [Chytriomyces sp. MP71]|nr:hypothetical protein BC830DRAFT_1110899 [Chytriomyces sp. MP71]